MTAEKIISDWKKGQFKNIYWLEGEENYFIDQITGYAEQHILTEAESAFNLTVFYGKEAAWADVINACRRYPVFADKQVVLLKEAQQMKDIEKLEPCIAHPMPSTIFVVAYKDKKLDGRTKLARLIKEKGIVLTTKKLYEKDLPAWVEKTAAAKGIQISAKSISLLVEYIGNDLSRLNNELEKIIVNLGSRKSITEADIENYIGISREYNVFELQAALMQKDLAKAIRIVQYFEGNPKAGPIQMVLPSLYSFFSKLFTIHGLKAFDKNTVADALGVNPFFVPDYLAAARLYSYPQVEKALLLLHHYNLRSVGVKDAGTEDASLLKEMLYKIVV
jgi:DNA polymerase-3 subunit delta